MRAVTARDATKSVLSLAASGPAVVFAGAFISCRAPSSLPMAVPLKRAIALSMWDTGRPLLVPALGTEPLKVLSGSRFWDVPLELLAEEVIKKSEVSVSSLLGWLANSQPNTNHRVLAALSDREIAGVATTNFDELIEVSATKPERIVKLHGTVSKPESMVIRLSQVGRGLVDRRFGRMLHDALSGKSVIFIGYAGRDPDIFPALGALGLKKVLWIARPATGVADMAVIESELPTWRALRDWRNPSTAFQSTGIRFSTLSLRISRCHQRLESMPSIGNRRLGLHAAQARLMLRLLRSFGCSAGRACGSARLQRTHESRMLPDWRQRGAMHAFTKLRRTSGSGATTPRGTKQAMPRGHTERRAIVWGKHELVRYWVSSRVVQRAGEHDHGVPVIWIASLSCLLQKAALTLWLSPQTTT